jgi:hypothetical protein
VAVVEVAKARKDKTFMSFGRNSKENEKKL